MNISMKGTFNALLVKIFLLYEIFILIFNEFINFPLSNKLFKIFEYLLLKKCLTNKLKI